MNLEEISAARAELERQLASLVAEFEATTGAAVTDITRMVTLRECEGGRVVRTVGGVVVRVEVV